MNRSKFYNSVRKSIFGGNLPQAQVVGMEAIFNVWHGMGGGRRKHLAYILATAFHEAKFLPLAESLNYSVDALISKFSRERISIGEARKYGRTSTKKADQPSIANTIYGGAWGKRNLGNIKDGDGWRYRGRGLVQPTGRANYSKFGLEQDPERALDINVAAIILIKGMTEGMFTGRRLDDYETFVSMRAIVNGNDAASLIASYAEKIDLGLIDAGYGFAPDDVSAPAPQVKPKPSQTIDKIAGGGAVVGGGAVIAIDAAQNGFGSSWALTIVFVAIVAIGVILLLRSTKTKSGK